MYVCVCMYIPILSCYYYSWVLVMPEYIFLQKGVDGK